jgi:hypothetical protein
VIEHRFYLDGLSHVIDVRDDAVFIASDIKDSCRSTRIADCDISLPEGGFGILKISPSRLARDLKPAFERSGMLLAIRFGLPKVSQHPSADHVHDFTLCELFRIASNRNFAFCEINAEIIAF